MVKQYEAVIQTLERLGGQATLAELYREVMKIEDCEWKTLTPFASIRRIVQIRPEIVKIRPGLWALQAHQTEASSLEIQVSKEKLTDKIEEQGHYYYQGLLTTIGNLRGYDTFIPNQDKNRLCVGRPLKDLRTLSVIPEFSYKTLVERSATVDVIWFNHRGMPGSFFEVENSTDIQNSLLKFYDLQDFHSRMVIVADIQRRREYDKKLGINAVRAIRDRISFLSYDAVVKQYEHEMFCTAQDFHL